VSAADPADALRGLRVLVVEDDNAISEQLTRGLRRSGCVTVAVRTGAEALTEHDVDMVLLDLGLPDSDGIEICRQLRERDACPIIVVTARDAQRDRVTALDFGADDYVVKPFGFEELLARMRAVLRRTERPALSSLRFGEVTLDVATRQATLAGDPLALTGKEFDILACLMSDPDRVISREEIFERVWDEHWYGPTRVLDVHLVALRRKLGDAARIETVYGRGFRLAVPS
jgi:DNA-binding response OmpR family regulator